MIKFLGPRSITNLVNNYSGRVQIRNSCGKFNFILFQNKGRLKETEKRVYVYNAKLLIFTLFCARNFMVDHDD